MGLKTEDTAAYHNYKVSQCDIKAMLQTVGVDEAVIQEAADEIIRYFGFPTYREEVKAD